MSNDLGDWMSSFMCNIYAGLINNDVQKVSFAAQNKIQSTLSFGKKKKSDLEKFQLMGF